MDKITIGQIAGIIGFLVALISGMEYLLLRLNKIFDKKLAPINNKIDKLDEAQCKNFLVSFLRDKEMNNPVDPVEEERAYEVYDHYTKPKDQGGLGGNSYIHAKWEKVMIKK